MIQILDNILFDFLVKTKTTNDNKCTHAQFFLAYLQKRKNIMAWNHAHPTKFLFANIKKTWKNVECSISVVQYNTVTDKSYQNITQMISAPKIQNATFNKR